MNKIIVCNLKMNKTLPEMLVYLDKIKANAQKIENTIICPSALYMPLFRNVGVTLGAQDITAYESLRLCGEIGGRQLATMGCKFVIIGHPDRRNYIKESDKVIIRKIKNTLSNDMIPIVCIGENKPKKSAMNQLDKQLSYLIKNLTVEEFTNIVIAYEPKYMVNSSMPVDPEIVNRNVDHIRKFIDRKFASNNIRILYGGNVDNNVINMLKNNNQINGFVMSRKSLNFDDLIKNYQ